LQRRVLLRLLWVLRLKRERLPEAILRRARLPSFQLGPGGTDSRQVSSRGALSGHVADAFVHRIPDLMFL